MIIAATIAAVLATAGTADAPTGARPILAVFVNVNGGVGARRLKYTANDIAHVRKALAPAIKKTWTVDNQKADRNAIIAAFKAAAKEADKGEILWLHFSGHGVAHGGKSYLVPHLREGSDLLRPERLVSVSELRTIAQRAVARGASVVLALDACHSGSARSNTALRSIAEIFGLQPDVSTLAATEVDREAYEVPGIESRLGANFSGGVFTYFLVKGLYGHAAPRGRVTLGNLERYVVAHVKRYTNGQQVPVFRIHPTNANTVLTARGAPGTMPELPEFDPEEETLPLAPGFVVFTHGEAGRGTDAARRLRAALEGRLVEAGCPLSAQGITPAEANSIRAGDVSGMAAVLDRRNARYLLVIRASVADVGSAGEHLVELQTEWKIVDGLSNHIAKAGEALRRSPGFDARQALNGALRDVEDQIFDEVAPFIDPE